MDAFQVLEEDYTECKITINNCLNELQANDTKSTVNDLTTLAQSNLVEAQRLLKLMTGEIRNSKDDDSSTKSDKRATLNVYREEIKALQRDLERARLVAATTTTKNSSTAESSILSSLEKSTDRLNESKRIVSETEHIGLSVLDTLASQRESLLSSRDAIGETNSMTSDARRILKRMSQRVLTNRIVLYCVIAFLSIAIITVFYHNFIKPASFGIL